MSKQIHSMETDKTQNSDSELNNLTPIYGACCVFYSCYTKWPQCIGCTQATTCLCVKSKGICCKPPTNDPKTCCICSDTSCSLIYPTTCVKAQVQEFCIEGRCAVPCDEDVPCIVNILGLTCFYKNKFKIACCQNFGSLG